MAAITVTVRDQDVDTLAEVAERQWRTPEQQASAFLEATLAAQRARSDSADRPRGAAGRPGRRSNGIGHTAVPAG